MSKALVGLMVSLSTLALSILLLRVNGWFGLGMVIGLVLSILYGFDVAHELRESPRSSRARQLLGNLMGIPQALFGVLCAAAGLAIVGWVLYNTFVERLPQYNGGFLTFGIGPVLVLFGFGWLVTAFRRGDGS
jgi:hypothetical protein